MNNENEQQLSQVGNNDGAAQAADSAAATQANESGGEVYAIGEAPASSASEEEGSTGQEVPPGIQGSPELQDGAAVRALETSDEAVEKTDEASSAGS